MIGPSFAYEYDFYECWLGENHTDNIEKKFGPIISYIKYRRAGEDNTWDEYRWTQYGVNPMGDPEMPLFTQEPLIFNNVVFDVDTTKITVNANEPGSKICVTGIGTESTYLRRTGTNQLTAKSLPDKFSVCITKQGFKPWHYVFQRMADGSIAYTEVESLNQYFSENMGLLKESYGKFELAYGAPLGFYITTSVNAKNSAKLIISKVTGEASKTVTIQNGIKITTHVPYFLPYPSGMYTISLIVDGQISDTWKVYV